ncbi:SIR2 family protein [Rossellomorea vietnamensis]|uniref:SIR2 family protein n=1 Tax=Rossellomorea vietnamensis TaxID=218284 RepID=UPI003CEF9286
MKFKENELIYDIQRYIESGHIHLLLGSGASIDSIKTLEDLESNLTMFINDYLKSENERIKGEIAELLNLFLEDCIVPNHELIERIYPARKGIVASLSHYKKLLQSFHGLLINRGSNHLPRKINIFTTNYDLFLELACEELELFYNDGGRGLLNRQFSSKNFQTRVYQLSDFYSYQYEEPVINIIKLHGSINWTLSKQVVRINNQVTVNPITVDDINESGYLKEDINLPIILPTKQKFIRTLMEHTYYDLTRLYANELEREQSVIFCFGFSFDDEHIRSITTRALNNPSLTLLLFPFSDSDEKKLLTYFNTNSNVKVIRLAKSVIDGDQEQVEYHLQQIKEYNVDPNRVNIDFNHFNLILENIFSKISKSKVFK